MPVKIVPYYDRTDIIHETMATLKDNLIEEAIVVGLIVILFLLHLRSSLAVLPTLPLALAMSFVVMYWLGVDSNIMSLAGIAIAIGDVSDMGIIMTENIYRRLADRTATGPTAKWSTRPRPKSAVPSCTAVVNTIISFIPVFALTGPEGKMFRPLAYTKTFAIAASVILAITVVPVLSYYLLKPVTWSRRRSLLIGVAGRRGCDDRAASWPSRGVSTSAATWSGWPTALGVGVLVGAVVYRMGRERLLPLEENRVSRAIFGVYRPTLRWVLAHKGTFLADSQRA